MVDQPLTWDLLSDLQLLLQFHFMQNAAAVGSIVAILAGAVGYFVVLRGQSFAAHMLSQVGFPGAAAAVLVNVSPVLGLLVFCVGAALGINAVGARAGGGRRGESAAIGSTLVFSLALGLLFFHLFAGSAQAMYAFLFGSILGISDRDVVMAAVTAGGGLAALVYLCRPLLLASIDAPVAEARGIPVGLLSTLFLVITAAAVAVSVQVVGTLLIFALLVAPAASAQRLTARPYLGILLSVVLSVSFTWAGLAVAYFSNYPVGFFISTFAFVTYLAVRAGTWALRSSGRSGAPMASPT